MSILSDRPYQRRKEVFALWFMAIILAIMAFLPMVVIYKNPLYVLPPLGLIALRIAILWRD